MAIRFREHESPVNYQIHPAAMLFPEMSDDEWKNLCDDIRTNGQREAIIIHGNQVIDGRNRLRACRWLKIEPKVRVYHGREEDITSFVLSLNLHRRHLTESQRAMIAAKVATARVGNPTFNRANLPDRAPPTNSEAAKMLNVSERSVKTAKQIAAKGEPEVAAAVQSGDMTINEAAKVVQLRPDQQRDVVAMPVAERRTTLKGNTLEELEVGKHITDPAGAERVALSMALKAIADLTASADDLIANCPKYAAPPVNKHFRQAFMKMQALNAAYQNWEHRNVVDA